MRHKVKTVTFRLLEAERDFSGKNDEARVILEWLHNSGWKLPSIDPAQLTTKQARQIMGKYAVEEISDKLIKAPKISLGEMAKYARANRRKLALQARARKAKAWLYWKRFKILDNKFGKAMKR
ncbi:MAG: hypothetical protein HY544_00965 [Candidatus Diapherotrites archaeon]|uniref:Uncharacterized protein n=1 Tax=Candidatus Iainarchaeum sp. TaxID=3101447 RepID=A0A8T3YII1_9ARCH|nr:hypothetical protein [Candidatus Diapherotrites archaeon]